MATSYANYGGTGDRTSFLIVTTTCAITDPVTNLVNGTKATGASAACFFTGATANGLVIKFDFGIPRLITEATWYQNGTSPQGTWKWQGSNDNSAFTDLSVGFTLDAGNTGAVIGDMSANTTAYRYYQIVKTGGTTNSTPWLEEIEFKIDPMRIALVQTISSFPSVLTVSTHLHMVLSQIINAFGNTHGPVQTIVHGTWDRTNRKHVVSAVARPRRLR